MHKARIHEDEIRTPVHFLVPDRGFELGPLSYGARRLVEAYRMCAFDY